MLACTCVDALNPQAAELTLAELASDVSVLEAFFDGVLGDRPNVLPGTVVPFGHFQDFLPTRSAGDGIV